MDEKIELGKANRMAEKLKKNLAPYCIKIEIAGSIRREKAEVGDIEIVCIPRRFKRKGKKKESHLDFQLKKLEKKNKIRMIKGGSRMKQFYLIRKDRTIIIKVDLFCVLPPAQWGVIYMIRTGPASFSKWLVSFRKPKGLKFDKGTIWKQLMKIHVSDPLVKSKKKLTWIALSPIPTEKKVFEILDTPFKTIKEREEY